MTTLRFRVMTIRAKVTLVILTACTLSLLAAAGLLVAMQERQAIRNLTDDLERAANGMGRNCTSAVEFDDRPYASNELAAFRADPSIVSAALYDARGIIFASYDRDGREPARVPMRIGGPAPAAGSDVVVELPISDDDGGLVGYVRVRSDTAKVQDAMGAR